MLIVVGLVQFLEDSMRAKRRCIEAAVKALFKRSDLENFLAKVGRPAR